jgi:hypothetical protein
MPPDLDWHNLVRDIPMNAVKFVTRLARHQQAKCVRYWLQKFCLD